MSGHSTLKGVQTGVSPEAILRARQAVAKLDSVDVQSNRIAFAEIAQHMALLINLCEAIQLACERGCVVSAKAHVRQVVGVVKAAILEANELKEAP